jgi:hypothetical protein
MGTPSLEKPSLSIARWKLFTETEGLELGSLETINLSIARSKL